MNFSARSILSRWRVLALLAVVLLAGGVKALTLRNNQGYQPTQPIYYSHKLHAGAIADGNLGMECLYCHHSAQKGPHAGIPSVDTCMGCHANVRGRQRAEEIAKLTEYYEGNQSIPWVRIHRVPDHVYFPHMQHVAAGVACQTCHGNIQEMDVVEQAETLSMGWCLQCHRDDSYIATPAAIASARLSTNNLASQFHGKMEPEDRIDVPYVSVGTPAYQTARELANLLESEGVAKSGLPAKGALNEEITSTIGYNRYAEQQGSGAIDHVAAFQNASVNCAVCHH